MTYQEFIEYLKKRAHEELGYDLDEIEFYPKGYTSEDDKKVEWIRESNRLYVGKESNILLTDFLVLCESKTSEITNLQRIAVKLLYEDAKRDGVEVAFQKIKDAKTNLDAANPNYEALGKRSNGDYETIRSQLFVRPLNYTLHIRDLHGCVYERFSDFALVLYQLLGDAEHTLTSSKIRREELKNWGMEDKLDSIMYDALENTARLFPACVYDYSKQKEVDFLTEEFSREDITFMGNHLMLSTFKSTNGAVSLFYPGVVQKMMRIMDGAFIAVFMNINDVMIFDLDNPIAKEFAKNAGKSSQLGEMLSNKCYQCDENGIKIVRK